MGADFFVLRFLFVCDVGGALWVGQTGHIGSSEGDAVSAEAQAVLGGL